MTNLAAMAHRVAGLTEPSHNLRLYAGALVHAAQMELLPAHAEDREHRQQSTRAVALRRLGRLDAEDRARVEAVNGVLE